MKKKLNDQDFDSMMKNYCARKTQLSFDAPMEEKTMTSKKGFRYAAAALALVAVISTGVFSSHIFGDSTAPQKQNSFVITANAAEMESGRDVVLTSKEFTPVGKIAPQLLIKGSDGPDEPFNCIGALLSTNIRCDGENIGKLTYSISNATFFLDKDNKMLSGLKKTDKGSFRKNGGEVYWDIKKNESGIYYASLNAGGEDQGGAVGEGLTYKDFYSEFTVDYENRNNAFEENKSRKSVFDPFEILGGYYNDSDKAISEQELYHKMIDDITISIKATFNDGTSETKKLVLHCDYQDEFRVTISAKLAD